MARRQIYTSESYTIEFDPAGMGTYWLVTKDGDTKGPYADQEAAKRAGASFLEAKLARPGEALEKEMAEDDDVLRREEARNRERFRLTPEEVEEEVEDLISRAKVGAARQRQIERDRQAARQQMENAGSVAETIARQLAAQKNAAVEGGDPPLPKFKAPTGDDA